MTCFELKEEKKEQKNSNPVMNTMFLVGLVLFASLVLVGSASATVWDNMSTMIAGMSTIMPAIASLISSVIEPMLLLVGVGFIVGLFDGLLGGITNALSFGRR